MAWRNEFAWYEERPPPSRAKRACPPGQRLTPWHRDTRATSDSICRREAAPPRTHGEAGALIVGAVTTMTVPVPAHGQSAQAARREELQHDLSFETIIAQLAELKDIDINAQKATCSAVNNYWAPFLLKCRCREGASWAIDVPDGMIFTTQRPSSALWLRYLFLFIHNTIQPRNKEAPQAKPKSVMAVVVAIARHHKNHDMFFPQLTPLKAMVTSTSKDFIQKHGVAALLASRVEALTGRMFSDIIEVPNGTVGVGGDATDSASVKGLNCRAAMALQQRLGFRKAEVSTPNGRPFQRGGLARASIVYWANGRYVTRPSKTLLRRLAAGGGRTSEGMLVQPPVSKCDPTGEYFGWQSAFIACQQGPGCAVMLMAKAELAAPCDSEDREYTPAFVRNRELQPVQHRDVEKHLRHHLLVIMTAELARWFTPHSWRVGAATALLDKGYSHANIQSLLRWRSPASVTLYARQTAQMFRDAQKIICGASTATMNVTHLWDMRDEAEEDDDE
jgi:hypothetical protein